MKWAAATFPLGIGLAIGVRVWLAPSAPQPTSLPSPPPVSVPSAIDAPAAPPQTGPSCATLADRQAELDALIPAAIVPDFRYAAQQESRISAVLSGLPGVLTIDLVDCSETPCIFTVILRDSAEDPVGALRQHLSPRHLASRSSQGRTTVWGVVEDPTSPAPSDIAARRMRDAAPRPGGTP